MELSIVFSGGVIFFAVRVVLAALEDSHGETVDQTTRDAILARPEVTYYVMGESFLEAGDFERAAELFARGERKGWTVWGNQADATYEPDWATYKYNSAISAAE